MKGCPTTTQFSNKYISNTFQMPVSIYVQKKIGQRQDSFGCPSPFFKKKKKSSVYTFQTPKTVHLKDPHHHPPTQLVQLVSGDPLVYGHVLQQVGLLSEGLGAVLAAEGFLAGVGAEVDLDVGLVEEAPVADLAVVHHFLAQIAAVYAATAAAAQPVAARGTGTGATQQGSL
jgi:hypothetical protein